MYCDTRLFGVKKWYHTAPESTYMRIPDEMQKSICFLCYKVQGGDDQGKYKPIGTGVFVGVPQASWDFLYLVTARHVVDIRVNLLPLYARLNTKDGGSRYVELPAIDKWLRFQNAAKDVAALPFALVSDDLEDLDFLVLQSDMLLTDQGIQKHSIGMGDDLFVVGLHVHLSGNNKNIPILRTGVISMMPVEPIYDQRYNNYHHSYLAELRSIGGLSGSPVYVLIDRMRMVDPGLEDGQDWKWALLGIIRGHHKLQKSIVDSNQDSDLVEDDLIELGVGEDLNMGIALVSVSQYITALLMNEQITQQRQEWIDAKGSGDSTLDVDVDVDVVDSEFTSADFDSALKKATRRISPLDQETKETSE